MKVVLTILLTGLTCAFYINGFSQSVNNFYVDVGYFARTTFNYYNTSNGQTSGPIQHHDAPYSHEKGVNGTGFNVALGLNVIRDIGVAVQASASIRYDFYQFDTPNNQKTFYFDLGLSATKSVFKKGYLGVGTTTFNVNKELRYEVGTEEKVLYLQFKSIDIFLGYPVWKLYIEPKLSIVSENFPGKIKDSANLLALKVTYRIEVARNSN